MKIKLTNLQIMNSVNPLNILTAAKLPIRPKYRLNQVILALDPIITEYNTLMRQISNETFDDSVVATPEEREALYQRFNTDKNKKIQELQLLENVIDVERIHIKNLDFTEVKNVDGKEVAVKFLVDQETVGFLNWLFYE